ncbi:replicative DNA helicase [Longispora sp. NPDC051575]|uniref:replicative DNA helicase n=1 Tax=Longispora sp. NPDC051575 TaxID=3154943 RepID=UPI00343B2D0A
MTDFREPPNDKAAEQIVLGAMMMSKTAIMDVSDIVTAEDFYQPKHATIFSTLVDMDRRREPTTEVAVTARLLERGELPRVGGASYLHTLLDAVPTVANAAWHARLVAERAVRQRIIAASARIAQLAYNVDDDAESLEDRATAALYAATSHRRVHDVQHIGDLLPAALEVIEKAGERQGLRGIPTGFTRLDQLTHGMLPGTLWVIAGRPSMGKSVSAVDLVRSALRHGRAALFVSLEMSEEELVQRLISAESGVPLRRLERGQMSDADWTAVHRASGHLAEAPLHIVDAPHVSVLDVRTRARRLAMRQPLGVVVVDYIQLMVTPSGHRRDTREREVADISRALKLLAKELNCCVIALAQLNRGPEQRPDRVPMLSDLRESGSLEQDPDIVVLLHRPSYYDRNARPGESDWILAKHRGGETATVTTAAQLHLARHADCHAA